MKKITINRKDMSISEISKKIIKISEEYELASQKNDLEKMKQLEKKYEYQKSILKSSNEFFNNQNEEEIKKQINTAKEVEKVQKAKWILKSKKEYRKNEDLYYDIMSSDTIQDASNAIKENNKRNLSFRKFKNKVLIGVTVAALVIGGLVGLNLKKQNQNKKNTKIQEQTIDNNTNDNMNGEIETNNNNKDIKNKTFSNDGIIIDESYKNLEYKGNGETIDKYIEKNGFPTSSTKETTVIEKEITNITLPPKPEDKITTEILKEDKEPIKIEDSNKDNDKKDEKEKVTVENKEEKPNDKKPTKIEETEDKKEDSTTEDKKEDESKDDKKPTDTEEKPDFKEPTYIEEDEKDIIYIEDENIDNNKPIDTEEKPDFKEPTYIEEDEKDISYISSLKNDYITLKNTIISQLSNNKVSKEVPILTYTSSKRC